MSDHLMRGFRVQLTTTMDSVLRTALFEVMKIFENALHDHKIQLAQKGEEIAQLKTKLQRAELKLKDLELECPRQAKSSQTQKQAKLVPDVHGWSSAIPRSDVAAAPDDWCAPLGCETVTKQEVNLYPNVKLRPFSIRLCHVPVKTEVVKHPINLQRNKPSRRSERISVFNTKSAKVQDKSKSNYDRGHPSPVQRCGVDVLLRDVRHIYSDLSGLERLRERKRSRETLTDQENPNGQRKRAAKESKSTELERERKYPCRYCNKVFLKEYGRRVHVSYHKKCQGCKKLFRFVESVKFHQECCAKYKKWMEKKVSNPPKTCEDENVPAPYKTQVTIKEETTETPVNNTEAFPLRNTCRICNYTFKSRLKLNKHMRIHSINGFFCSMCPKAFLSIGALKGHVTKRHQDHANVFDTKEDLGWTRPLEDIEEN